MAERLSERVAARWARGPVARPDPAALARLERARDFTRGVLDRWEEAAGWIEGHLQDLAGTALDGEGGLPRDTGRARAGRPSAGGGVAAPGGSPPGWSAPDDPEAESGRSAPSLPGAGGAPGRARDAAAGPEGTGPRSGDTGGPRAAGSPRPRDRGGHGDVAAAGRGPRAPPGPEGDPVHELARADGVFGPLAASPGPDGSPFGALPWAPEDDASGEEVREAARHAAREARRRADAEWSRRGF